MMSTTYYQFADNTPLFQDLINIQVPQYQNGGLPTCYIPTSAGVNPMYAYQARNSKSLCTEDFGGHLD